MFCANCGAVLKDCSKFCHACGQKVENDIVGGNEMDKGATKCSRFKSYAARGLPIFDLVARRRRRRGKKIPSH